jgi:hypothetical protein
LTRTRKIVIKELLVQILSTIIWIQSHVHKDCEKSSLKAREAVSLEARVSVERGSKERSSERALRGVLVRV